MSLLALAFAGFLIKGTVIRGLVGFGFLAAAPPFVNTLILWLLQVDVNFHGISMGASLTHGALSFATALLPFVSASAKHIRAGS